MLEYRCAKKNVSKLLKTALDVEMSEHQIGDVKQVYTNKSVHNFAELWKSFEAIRMKE